MRITKHRGCMLISSRLGQRHETCGRDDGQALAAIGRVVLLAATLSLAACTGGTPSWLPEKPSPKSNYVSGGMKALNYTPYYIHSFEVDGPEPVGGGGPNVMPVRPDGRPSGGGKESCCMTFPRQWQPDLRVTVRWLVEKVKDGKTPGYWYKAENVRIAQYDGSQTGGAFAIFLPGDRVRLLILDGTTSPREPLPDGSPFISQGVRDDEWNLKYRRGGLQ